MLLFHVGHYCVPELQLVTTEHDVSCGFVIYGLYYVEVCSLCTHFAELFLTINRCWVLSNAFPAFIKMIIDFYSSFFFFFSLWVSCRLICGPCISGINPTWSICMFFSSIVEFNLLNFYISFDEGYWSLVFFFGNVFVWVQ